jgi:hypothetical protein
VYAALRERDGREVVLKAYRSRRGRTSDEARMQREGEALGSVAGPGVPAVLEVLIGHNPPLLVLARAPGVSFGHWCRSQPSIDSAAFVRVAAQLADVLMRVHARHLIHRDLTPENIVVDPSTLETHLLDFGLTRRLGTAAEAYDASTASGTSADTLRYIAPEQTGRMNRGCDFRSDLYSLGCVLYLALAGRPPFDADDPLELVHSHIARVPTAPSLVRPEVAEPLSKLVLKLLSKEPEARYQSARALRADLEACREQLERSGRIDAEFVPGRGDAPERPRFSRTLLGREAEAARIEHAFSACTRGATRVLLLEGDPGMGKSSLVEGLRPRVADAGGYLARAKFDLYRDRPYAGWATLVESIAQQILLESDERLGRWRQDLRASLGNIARVLVDLAPDLGFVMGEVAPVPALGPGETRARLSLALQRFVAAAATPAHPLVLFLDDLQSCDAGSRVLLDDLLAAESPAALLVIGAYRRGTTDGAHPLVDLLPRLAQCHVELEVLPVGPLPPEALRCMLAEALERPLAAIASLAETIERKTGSSPLLVQQFIEHIHGCGLLHYEQGLGWTWEPSGIAAADIPDGAVALMTAKLAHLERDAREVLQLASCVGDEFDAQLLASLDRRERGLLDKALFALCEAGLVAPCANGFRFVHDRIREAAQKLLSESERSRLHAETAQLLLGRLSHAEQAERVFEIVEHLNRGRSHLPADQHQRAIGLNLLAGKRALASGAGATAARYLGAARELFTPEDWKSQRELGIELSLESAESAFQSRRYEAGLELLAELEQQPLARIERARAAAKRLRILPLLRPSEEVVRTTLEVLRRFGVRWPLHPSRLRARLALRVTGWMFALRGSRKMLQPGAASDPDRLAPMLVIAPTGPSMLLHDIHLAALSAARSLRWYLRFGHLTSPSYRLSAYAIYSHLLLGNAELTRRYARIALEWNERVPNATFGTRTEHVIHTLLHPWLMRRREALAPMSRVIEAIRELGDPEFFQYARFSTILYLGLAGDPVADIERRLREHAASIAAERPWHAPSERMHRTYSRLLAATDAEANLEADLEESRATHRAYSCYVSTVWMLVLCVLGRHDLAFEESEWIGARLFRISPHVHVADHTFYRGLAAAQLATRARGAQRRTYLRALQQSRKRMRGWSRGGPDFEHMALLLEAELARLRGRGSAASDLYERAAQRALRQEYLHHAALAYEHRARLLAAERRDTAAAAAQVQAMRLYQQWGARAKLAALGRAPSA